MALDQERGTSMEKLMRKLKASPKLMIGDTPLIIEMEGLDEYALEKAERELRETPELAQESLKVLIDMLAEEEDLYVPLEEEFLQKFLRRCKWYPKSAFKLIKRFYEYHQNHPEYYKDLLPSNERAVFTSGVVTPLPRRTSDGVRIVLVEAGRKWNPKQVSLEQIFKAVIMILEVALTEPKTQISGVRVLVDMEGLTLSHVSYFTPRFASSVVEFVQKAIPARLKGVHIINQSFVFDMVFSFFKPFLHGKLKDRIFFHGGDRTSFLNYVDAKALPSKYGGEYDIPEEPLGQAFHDFALIFEDYFKELGRYGYSSE